MTGLRDGGCSPLGRARTFALVATVKDEGPYLWEWVAYHRMIGFHNIIIFQNDSADGTHEILTEMARQNLVTYRYNRAPRGCHQVRAYTRATRQQGYMDADYVMALDLDEFLVIHAGDGTLPALFDAMPEFDCAYINWQKFGNSGFVAPQNGLVTENFTRCENPSDMAVRVEAFKALFRRTAYERPGVHNPRAHATGAEGLRIVNGSGLPADAFETRNFQCSDPGLKRFAQINHYIVRDASSFILKSAKGSAHQANRNIDHRYWKNRNKNESQDVRLAVKAPKLRAAMQEMDLLTEGKLSALTRQARAVHRRGIEAAMAEDWARKLYELCVSDPSSQLPAIAASRPSGTVTRIEDKRPKAVPTLLQTDLRLRA